VEEVLQSISTRKATPEPKQADHEARNAVIVPGSARLLIGRLRILLLAEDVRHRDWRLMDYFPLHSAADHDLLMVVHEMTQTGYAGIQSDLSPAVFSPGGARDPEALAAGQRLANRGLAVFDEIIANRDPKLIWWADGDHRPRRSRK
jgi:hypothetical protein